MRKGAGTGLPLEGVKAIELGQLIAGPLAGRALRDFGAAVIKTEPLGKGDSLRNWRAMQALVSVWREVQPPDKNSVPIDLRAPEGQQLEHELCLETDGVIGSFRSGSMQSWGPGLPPSAFTGGTRRIQIGDAPDHAGAPRHPTSNL